MMCSTAGKIVFEFGTQNVINSFSHFDSNDLRFFNSGGVVFFTKSFVDEQMPNEEERSLEHLDIFLRSFFQEDGSGGGGDGRGGSDGICGVYVFNSDSSNLSDKKVLFYLQNQLSVSIILGQQQLDEYTIHITDSTTTSSSSSSFQINKFFIHFIPDENVLFDNTTAQINFVYDVNMLNSSSTYTINDYCNNIKNAGAWKKIDLTFINSVVNDDDDNVNDMVVTIPLSDDLDLSFFQSIKIDESIQSDIYFVVSAATEEVELKKITITDLDFDTFNKKVFIQNGIHLIVQNALYLRQKTNMILIAKNAIFYLFKKPPTDANGNPLYSLSYINNGTIDIQGELYLCK